MYEVEVKVRADHDAVRAALAEADARLVGAVEQVDTYYDAPHRDFASTDEALRVRRERAPEGSGESAGDGAGDDTRGDADSDAGVDESGDAGEADDADEKARVTYKGPLVEAASKTRREVETRVGDADAAAGVFSALGFEPAAEVRKERTRYALDGFTVTLDAVEGVGEFVEVETEVEDDADVAAARDRAFDVLRRLGLDPGDQTRTSYLELVLCDE